MAAILILSIRYNSRVNSATNCGPRSETTLRGMPWSFQTCWMNSLAVPTADRVVNVGTKWARLVKESTTTIIASWPDDSGSSMMKSTLTVDALRSLYARANKKNNNKQCDKGALYVLVLITKSSWAEMHQIK